MHEVFLASPSSMCLLAPGGRTPSQGSSTCSTAHTLRRPQPDSAHRCDGGSHDGRVKVLRGRATLGVLKGEHSLLSWLQQRTCPLVNLSHEERLDFWLLRAAPLQEEGLPPQALFGRATSATWYLARSTLAACQGEGRKAFVVPYESCMHANQHRWIIVGEVVSFGCAQVSAHLVTGWVQRAAAAMETAGASCSACST